MTLQEICLATKEVVLDTAQFIASELGKVQLHQIEDKEHNSLVSYVDKTAEEKLVAGLSSILPEATFLTEEGTIEQKSGEWTWIIDPLDGTTNFLHQVPVFSISIGLQHVDQIVVGVIFEINREECFYAWKDGGAYLNGRPIHVRETDDLTASLIATGFPSRSRSFDKLEAYLKTFRQLLVETRGLRRMGSAAVDLAYVAAGRFEAFFEYGLHPWDAAAGVILVQEAGGRVSDFKDGNQFLTGKEILASNSKIHEPLLEVINQKPED